MQAQDVAAALEDIGVASQSFPGDLLAHPHRIRSKEGRGLRVFTPFWKRVQALGDPTKPLPAPKTLSSVSDLASNTIEDWGLEPTHPGLAGGLRETLDSPANRRRKLASALSCKIEARAMGPPATGRIAMALLDCHPHLRFGEISPRQIWHAARFAADERPSWSGDIEKFLSELSWREFCRHLLFDVPDLAERNLQPSFDAFPWRQDKDGLTAWQRGRTGYPIVDAGMRELWHTGIMHNRVRMVAASFLVKHPPDRLARRREMVLGHAGRCRRGQQPGKLAMGRRLRSRRRPLFPRVQSGLAGREV